MNEVQHLVATYGYWLMLFGALIEGETFLLAGGIAAQQGMLHLPGLILLGFIGSTIHDNVFFFLGRYAGGAVLKRKPKWKSKADATLNLFDKYGVLLIIALRFMYGFRTIIPTVIGMSPISYSKFLIFDIIGGIIWSSTFILAGYLFGQAIEAIADRIHYYEALLFKGLIVIVIFSAICGVVYLFWRRRK